MIPVLWLIEEKTYPPNEQTRGMCVNLLKIGQDLRPSNTTLFYRIFKEMSTRKRRKKKKKKGRKNGKKKSLPTGNKIIARIRLINFKHP